MSTAKRPIIRPVTKNDLLAVREQLIETWHATYDAIYGPDMVRDITQRWHSLVALAQQLDGADSTFLLIEENGRVLGSSYAQLADGTAKLFRLYVHPQAQRRSLGRQLMAETFLRFPGAIKHRLEVEPRNTAAIAFYEREGFVRFSEIPDPGMPSGIAAYIYERGPDPHHQRPSGTP